MEAATKAPEETDEVGEGEPLGSGNGQPPTEPQAGDMEGAGAGEQAPAPMQLEIDGSRKQLTLKVGGKLPEQSQVKLRAGSIAVPRGEYEKGDEVDFALTVRCTEVHFVDKMDNQTGEVVDTIRRHIFKVSKIEKV